MVMPAGAGHVGDDRVRGGLGLRAHGAGAVADLRDGGGGRPRGSCGGGGLPAAAPAASAACRGGLRGRRGRRSRRLGGRLGLRLGLARPVAACSACACDAPAAACSASRSDRLAASCSSSWGSSISGTSVPAPSMPRASATTTDADCSWRVRRRGTAAHQVDHDRRADGGDAQRVGHAGAGGRAAVTAGAAPRTGWSGAVASPSEVLSSDGAGFSVATGAALRSSQPPTELADGFGPEVVLPAPTCAQDSPQGIHGSPVWPRLSAGRSSAVSGRDPRSRSRSRADR